MIGLTLTAEEVACAQALVGELAAKFRSADDPEFQGASRVYAEELPRNLRDALNALRSSEEQSACLISGFPVDDGEIGPTPSRFGGQVDPASTLERDFFFFLCGSLLGDPIG